MNCSSSHSRLRHGFTLLELSLAVAMTAILGVSLYAALAIAFNARDSVRRHTTAPALATIALDVIRQDLESVLPPGPPDVSLAGAFVGVDNGGLAQPADRVEFHTIGRDPRDPSIDSATIQDPFAEGIRWVELSLRMDLNPPALVRRIERNLLTQVVQEPTEEILLTGVTAFDVRYLDGSAWVEQWDSTQSNNALPLAVEIMIEFDQPAPTDPSRNYRVTQVFPLACGNLEALSATTQ